MRKLFIIIFLYLPFSFSQNSDGFHITDDCRQIIIVLTDSVKATSGKLTCFQKSNDKQVWEIFGESLPAVIGKNGFGWGNGLSPVDSIQLPVKVEGDGKSPAGVFKLGAAFGYARAEEMKGLKIQYIPITETCECVDDKQSEYYNKIVYKNQIKDAGWNSSEKMFYADIWYQQGIVIEQNSDPIVKGAGSCVFLHNWSMQNETTVGCTEIEPSELTKIIYWLDNGEHPLIVQLTNELYEYYKTEWKLP